MPSNVTIRHLKYMRAKIRKDYRLKTHRKHGHEYTEENTCYAAAGTGRNRKRQCRICRNSAQRKRRAPANPGRRTNQHTKVKLAIQALWDRLLRHPDHTYKIKMLEAKREYDEWLERTKSQRRGKTICVGAGKPGKKAA